MTIIWLCRYICIAFALLFLMSLLTSYAPNAENFATICQTITGGAALVAAIAAILLNRMPKSHWIRRSKPTWIVFVLIAIAVTVLIVSVG